MKSKNLLLALAGLVLLPTATSCKKEEIETLVIYNWEDYIFEGDDETDGIIDQFIEYYEDTYGERINVEYYTFETNENMLNVLKTGKSHYDLVCPSDYIIQKMIMEDMVEPISNEYPLTNYDDYASPYVKSVFEKSTVKVNGETRKWSDYAIPYFWGTMGFMYDPEIIPDEAATTWSTLVNPDYKGLFTIKDSVRDTYCAGILYAYSNNKFHLEGFGDYSLNDLAKMYENGDLEADDYNNYVSIIMNDTSDETLELVKESLKEAKENCYGFEVDSGKADIVTGKIAMNFCWSGDAVYAMDCAEEDNDKYLNYQVPCEGSNVWFDGWVMPKGANVKLAQRFLNFLSLPEIASLNMNEVGYTNSIAGDEIYEMVVDWYGADSVYQYVEEDDTTYYGQIKEEAGKLVSYDPDGNVICDDIQALVDKEELYPYDLSYFFGNTISEDKYPIIYSDENNRQFSAQFPDAETLVRCAVMQDFGDRNINVLETWSQIKSNDVPVWAYVFVGIVVIVLGYGIISFNLSKKIRTNRINEKKKAV